MKFKRTNNLKRIAVLLATKSLQTLGNLSRRIGFYVIGTLIRLMREFIDSQESRQVGFWILIVPVDTGYQIYISIPAA